MLGIYIDLGPQQTKTVEEDMMSQSTIKLQNDEFVVKITMSLGTFWSVFTVHVKKRGILGHRKSTKQKLIRLCKWAGLSVSGIYMIL